MRRKGFTLIELLVVIAIIGILAAMLFPVFARARESARKTQCLANVKNMALAINMYLTDYDRFPPSEKRAEVIDYFANAPGGGPVSGMHCGDPDENNGDGEWGGTVGNPYLKWPVLLDDYVKNRDVWKCPSAKMEASAQFIYNDGGNWLGWLQANTGNWGAGALNGDDFGPLCSHQGYPSGWGGEITDSIVQQAYAAGSASDGDNSKANRVFIQSIGAACENLMNLNLSSVQDAAKLIVVADSPPSGDWLSIARIAYPDICCTECSGIAPFAWGWPSDSCPSGAYCPDCWASKSNLDWHGDPSAQKSSARHLGGSNIGFGDGHAKWIAARAIIAMSDNHEFEGVGWTCGPTSVKGYAAAVAAGDCAAPDPGMVFLHTEDIDWYGK